MKRAICLFLFSAAALSCKTVKNDDLRGKEVRILRQRAAVNELSDISAQIQTKLELESNKRIFLKKESLRSKKTTQLKPMARTIKKSKKTPVKRKSSQQVADFESTPDLHDDNQGRIDYKVSKSRLATRRTSVFFGDEEAEQSNELYASHTSVHHIHLRYQVHVPRKRQDSMEILQLVKTIDPQLRACYVDHIATANKYFEGKITYAFKIKKLSQSFNHLAQKSQKKVSEDLNKCITLTLGRLRFSNNRAYRGDIRLSFAKVKKPKEFQK